MQAVATMFEKLPGCRPEAGPRPDISEATPKFTEVLNQNRRIHGSTKRTANESGRGLWRRVDGLIHRCDFCDRNTSVNYI
jgi:hypothetical protein